MSPDAGLPDSLCRLMSLNLAACRRSLGQILGQPILPRAHVALLCLSDPRSYTPDGWPDPAAVPRRARAFSTPHVAAYAQVEAPATDRCVQIVWLLAVLLAGGTHVPRAPGCPTVDWPLPRERFKQSVSSIRRPLPSAKPRDSQRMLLYPRV